MKNLSKGITTYVSNRFAIPVLLLVVTFFAYGLTFWRLGFYWDDLHILWTRYHLGPDAITRYFSDARPVWGLLYQLTGYILPLNAAVWQLFAMLCRWAGALAFWLVLQRLFPRRKNLILFLSLLFLLYPGFNQQWVSYVYSHFFIVLFFLLISWYLMLRGKTIPAMVFSALNLLMFEYFFLHEFIRPLIIFKSLQDEQLTNRERYVKTFKIWLPYIGVILLVVLYRTVVFSHPGFGYSLTDELIRNPVATSLQLLQQVLSSLWATAIAAWLQAFQLPNPGTTGLRTSVLYVFVVLAVGALVFTFRHIRSNEGEPKNRSDAFWLLGLGGILLIFGGVPFWVSNLPVTLGFPANLATLSFMFGACFFLIGLLDLMPVRIKYVAALVLVSLSAGRQFLWSVDYMRDWQSQKNLFWQMAWRVPGLQPGTIVMMNEELEYYADNSIGAALNWIYAPGNRSSRVEYALFYPTNRLGGTLTAIAPGLPVRFDYYFGHFEGNTSNTLAFYYSPPGCLRLLDPEIDPYNRLIPEDSYMRDVAQFSSTDLVLSKQVAEMPVIYAPEPSHNWCYYFEQADLARQERDWEQVVKLGNIAFQLSDYPNDTLERFVFIEGYAHAGQWEKALEQAQVSFNISKRYIGPLLCRLWERIERETPSSPEKEEYLVQAKTLFVCNP
jgi:hypothetical protein